MIHNLDARRSVVALLVLLLAVLAAACSGGDDDADSDAGATATGDSEASIVMGHVVEGFPDGFEPITPSTPVEVSLPDGSSAWVAESGPADGTPVLFAGGSSTAATAVDLVSFLASAQAELGIRLISVERNGFGPTPLDPEAGYEEFAATVLGVMDTLGVDQFSVVAISGGGPYASQLAASAPERIRSLHLAAAYTGTPDAGALAALCATPPDAREPMATGYANDPESWWTFADDSIAHRIPGFVDAAVADGTRAAQTVGGVGDPAPMLHEFGLFCEATAVDLSAVTAPAFLYYSEADATTPVDFAADFSGRLPNVVADRRDLIGNHDEQYRHWDQILLDLAAPEDPGELVCSGGEEVRVALGDVPAGVTRGACLWSS